MKKFLLSLPIERPERTKKALKHLAEMEMDNVQVIQGLDANFSGLVTTHPYEVDNPGSGFNMGAKPVGIFLAHYMAWTVAKSMDIPEVLIMEDDVQLHQDWKERMRFNLEHAPKDWDVIFFGSCDTNGHLKKRVSFDLWEVFYPQCLHCYAVRQKALGYMLATQRKVYGPMDCTLIFHTWPALRVYTLLPRLAVQFDTIITP